MPSVMPHSIVKVKQSERLVFAVPLPTDKVVYMSIDQAALAGNDHQVVIVEAEKFLNLWRAEPTGFHATLANGNPDVWPHSQKFHLADAGFSKGLANPVPLADVSCDISESGSGYVFFSNGITRTTWLLAHGCQEFPILSPMPGATILQRFAAAAGYKMLSVRSAKHELFAA